MRSRPKARLSPDVIASEALRLIDRDGLEALSMRRLGEALGVEAMALYHHFASRSAVLDAVTERLIAEVELPAASSDVVAWLGEVVRRYVAIAVSHPEAFPLLATRRFNTAASFAFVERQIEALTEAGASAEVAADIFRGLGAFANGAGLTRIAAARAEVSPIDAIRLPHVARAARWLGPSHLERQFEANLTMILDGVAQRLRAGQATSGAHRRNAKKTS